MYQTNEEIRQRALLVAADCGEYDVDVSLDELEELTETAGAQVVGRLIQKRSALDSATCVGAGRLQEAAAFCQNNQVDLLVFDHELTAAQIRNIERICDVAVLDRTMVILDIFAQRANTSEGRLQVELAQQRYRLPRLMGLGQSLSRLGGGVGTRGPGETKLETDRRHIRRRIQTLEAQLEELKKRRNLQRSRRRKDGMPVVAVVGYTNVGKSTLLNALTGAQVLSKDMLFATLDTTSRALELPDGRQVLVVDTVGFIRRLPHHLVMAFKSTLEEAAYADLILNVCDISSPEAQAQVEVTTSLLEELGAGNTPTLMVLNKADKLTELPEPLDRNTVLISAKTGMGLEELKRRMAQMIQPSQLRVQLCLPYDQGGLLAKVRENGRVFSQEYRPEGLWADCLVDRKVLHLVEGYCIAGAGSQELEEPSPENP